MTIEKAIKRLENIRNDAQAVLDTGFGNKPSESNITYVSNKEMAELAISALKKQIPKKVKNIEEKTYVLIGICPNCQVKLNNIISHDYCEECGQAIDWSEANDK